ncbi:guanine nucleotide-binding protein subunit gamma-1-like [Brevipalpus obovatus]|uniref:guanine nucleotide-binding protein subunit gamma-1-like n=1 Tax=Brevipalpus obovatus TaxID=246614 RepID=UPI003D9EC51B
MSATVEYTKMNAIQQQGKLVQQLRTESALQRIKLSVAIEDLKKYVMEHEQDDYLVVGFHSQKTNPFREKSSCLVI